MSEGKKLSCSFCGKDQQKVRKLFASDTACSSIRSRPRRWSRSLRASICDECVGLCLDIIREQTAQPPIIDPPVYCSFCAKSQRDVPTLIAGPEDFICENCVKRFAVDLPPHQPYSESG